MRFALVADGFIALLNLQCETGLSLIERQLFKRKRDSDHSNDKASHQRDVIEPMLLLLKEFLQP
jgi:hypothetical protein